MEKDEIIIQSIIDAAKKLMQQYGLSKTTMEDIYWNTCAYWTTGVTSG